MGWFGKLFKRAKVIDTSKPLDVSETVADVVGGGLVGLAVGELVEEGVKEVKKKRSPKKKAPK